MQAVAWLRFGRPCPDNEHTAKNNAVATLTKPSDVLYLTLPFAGTAPSSATIVWTDTALTGKPATPVDPQNAARVQTSPSKAASHFQNEDVGNIETHGQ